MGPVFGVLVLLDVPFGLPTGDDGSVEQQSNPASSQHPQAQGNLEVNPAASLTTPALLELRDAFQLEGFGLRLVGGCVRDALLGHFPNDVDLHTDATPDEATAIYKRLKLRWIPTGIEHGTVTVVLDDITYEITSLRKDVSTDGRRAVVEYTRDWYADALRRDFTVNSISMSFEGELFDPFGGLKDLQAGVVRFVGDPAQRIQEDYLRILRLYRFTGRFGKEVDEDARRAVAKHRAGLDSISVERVWSEMRRIISGPQGPHMVDELYDDLWGIEVIGSFWPRCADIKDVYARTVNPITLMAVGWGAFAPDRLAEWKASREEIDMCIYLVNTIKTFCGKCNPFREMALYNVSREWALELAAVQNMDPLERTILETWEVPHFPVSGNDLMQLGMRPSPEMGRVLRRLRETWADSGYSSTKDALLTDFVP